MDQNSSAKPLFTFIHFNDVYDIQEKKTGHAGIVNFEAYVRKLRKSYPEALVIFSGDAFSPSILTNIYEGKQMVYALNKLNIDVACMGNHQFDLEPQQTEELFNMTNFPWLQGNIRMKENDELLGKGRTHLVKEVNGKRIGFFGVAGQDWLGILGDDYEDELVYEDVNEFSQKICKVLREEEHCDMIVGLTHMRVPQDVQLPEKVPQIDISLGGHDHIIMEEFINQIPVLKSGSDFKNLGLIQVYEKGTNENAKYKGKRFDFDIEIQEVPIAEDEIDSELREYVDKCMAAYQKFDRLVGYTDVPLETRFCKVRAIETNYGNFLADLVRSYFDSDCCVLNSGCIRNDLLFKPGKLKYSMISNLINDMLVVKQIPGKVLLQSLEYAVSALPDSYAGSFLLISGIRYNFDYRKEPKVQQVQVYGKPLDLEQKYSIAMKSYLAGGGDGFSMFKECRYIIDPTSGIQTLSLLMKFFKGADMGYEDKLEVAQMIDKRKSKHPEDEQEDDDQLPDEIPPELLRMSKRHSTKLDRISKLRLKQVMGPNGKKFVCIAPKLDGRIKSLADEQEAENGQQVQR